MAGLVLVMDDSGDEQTNVGVGAELGVPEGVDGVLKSNGILKFSEMVSM